MARLNTWRHALVRVLLVDLLIAGIFLLIAGLGARFYGHVGDPDGDWIKITAIGAGCIAGAITLNRLLKSLDVEAKSRGFPVVGDRKDPRDE